MRKINSIIRKTCVIAGLSVALQACKVDVAPVDRYTDLNVWSNAANIELYTANLYNEFRPFQFGTFPIGYNNTTDALSDIEKFTSSASGNGTVNVLATDASRVTAGGPQLNYWTPGYKAVSKLNVFIDGLYKYAKVGDDAKKVYEAEARFIRGYVYFWLVKLHGSVIIYDNMAKYSNTSNQRSSEEDCWKFIASDFTYAAENLPVTRDAAKLGRATKGAAYGMLARTWLYAASIAQFDKKQFNGDPMTGVSASNAAAYYQKAADAAGQVIALADQGVYSLEPDYASIFYNKKTKESLFQLDFVAPQVTNDMDLGFAPAADAAGQCLVYGVPTAELVNEYQMSDGTSFSWNSPTQAANPYVGREKRFYASILYNGATWKGRKINTLPSSTTEGYVQYGTTTDPKRTVTGYYRKKMLDSTNTTFTINHSTQSWIEMRYAEVLLIDAEARAMLNDVSGSQRSLNKVRDRAGLPATSATTADQLLQAVEHERIVELAFEGHRYWDLRRWRKAHTLLNNVQFTGHRIAAVGAGFNYEVVSCDNTNRQFTPALYYIPIPTTELQNNTGLSQILGW